MSSASVYPAHLDTDTQLLRRAPADVMTINDHNNLVDALEQIELSVGSVDDGTAGGGAQAFTSALADVVAFQSTAQQNPRYPVMPIPANAWYGYARNTPAAWTLGAGVVASYTKSVPLARLSGWGAPPTLIASADVIGAAPWVLFFRLRPGGLAAENTARYGVGFSADGSGTDLDGIAIYTTGPSNVQGHIVHSGTESSSPTMALTLPLGLFCVVVDATTLTCYESADAYIWYQMATTYARAGAPTKVVLTARANESTPRPLWLDFITQGNVVPANDAG